MVMNVEMFGPHQAAIVPAQVYFPSRWGRMVLGPTAR